MNVESFFNDLNEKTWRKNIRFHAERKFDALIEFMQESKEEILDEIISDIKEIELMKNEDKETFEYESFEKWLGKLSRSNMADWIDNDEED
jgi:hypothetical protein